MMEKNNVIEKNLLIVMIIIVCIMIIIVNTSIVTAQVDSKLLAELDKVENEAEAQMLVDGFMKKNKLMRNGFFQNLRPEAQLKLWEMLDDDGKKSLVEDFNRDNLDKLTKSFEKKPETADENRIKMWELLEVKVLDESKSDDSFLDSSEQKDKYVTDHEKTNINRNNMIQVLKKGGYIDSFLTALIKKNNPHLDNDDFKLVISDKFSGIRYENGDIIVNDNNFNEQIVRLENLPNKLTKVEYGFESDKVYVDYGFENKNKARLVKGYLEKGENDDILIKGIENADNDFVIRFQNEDNQEFLVLDDNTIKMYGNKEGTAKKINGIMLQYGDKKFSPNSKGKTDSDRPDDKRPYGFVRFINEDVFGLRGDLRTKEVGLVIYRTDDGVVDLKGDYQAQSGEKVIKFVGLESGNGKYEVNGDIENFVSFRIFNPKTKKYYEGEQVKYQTLLTEGYKITSMQINDDIGPYYRIISKETPGKEITYQFVRRKGQGSSYTASDGSTRVSSGDGPISEGSKGTVSSIKRDSGGIGGDSDDSDVTGSTRSTTPSTTTVNPSTSSSSGSDSFTSSSIGSSSSSTPGTVKTTRFDANTKTRGQVLIDSIKQPRSNHPMFSYSSGTDYPKFNPEEHDLIVLSIVREGCGPCRNYEATNSFRSAFVSSYRSEENNVAFQPVDWDEHKEFASSLGVKQYGDSRNVGIPAVILIDPRTGRSVGKPMHAPSSTTIQNAINNFFRAN